MNPLRQQMDADMIVRRNLRELAGKLSQCVWPAERYHHSPERISDRRQSYLLYLLRDRELAWSSCNIVTYGLKFFYHHTLKRRDVDFRVPAARQPQKLPEILGREEVAALISGTKNLKHRVILMSTYSAGLRVSEVCALKSLTRQRTHDDPQIKQCQGSLLPLSTDCSQNCDCTGERIDLGATYFRRRAMPMSR
jgi:site-specific recombinase XerD